MSISPKFPLMHQERKASDDNNNPDFLEGSEKKWKSFEEIGNFQKIFLQSNELNLEL
jgi:hypothetical protein